MNEEKSILLNNQINVLKNYLNKLKNESINPFKKEIVTYFYDQIEKNQDALKLALDFKNDQENYYNSDNDIKRRTIYITKAMEKLIAMYCLKEILRNDIKIYFDRTMFPKKEKMHWNWDFLELFALGKILSTLPENPNQVSSTPTEIKEYDQKVFSILKPFIDENFHLCSQEENDPDLGLILKYDCFWQNIAFVMTSCVRFDVNNPLIPLQHLDEHLPKILKAAFEYEEVLIDLEGLIEHTLQATYSQTMFEKT